MPDDSKVFDVSKPNRVSPSPTSRPIIVGQRPQNSDPMVNEDPKSQDSSPEHTPIQVTINDDGPTDVLAKASEPEIPSIAKEDIEKALASLNSEEPQHGEDLHNPMVLEPEHHMQDHEEPEHHSEEHTVLEDHPDSVKVHESEHDSDQEHEHAHEPEHESEHEPEHENHDGKSAFGFTPIHQLVDSDEDDDHHKNKMTQVNDGGWQDVPPLSIPQGAGPKRRWPKVLFVLILLAIIGAYFAIDGGLVQSDINLPFHILNKQKSSNTTVNPPPTPAPALNNNQSNSNSSSSLPAGFKAFTLTGTNISFAYPAAWGSPTTSADAGFSKRGGTIKSDGTHAYIVKFATNKDVELALTSAKYLPVTRGAQYYDFLQFCIGTVDKKYYAQTLHFSTTAGVDTSTNAVCDYGPLNDASLIGDGDPATDRPIVQLKTKGTEGKTVIGDLYTKNLTDTNFVVLRVKDSTMKNSSNITKLLSSVKVSSSSDISQ